METLIKADIFFLISSAATIVITVLVSILLFYLIRAGKNLYTLSEALKGGLRGSEEFVSELKERLENNFIFRLLFPPLRRKKRTTIKDDTVKND